jgi:hypothetical protein
MSYPQIDQPEELHVKLFPHQKTSVWNMEKMEREMKVDHPYTRETRTRIGVFGDIPGYGKSFSIVALLLRDKMEFPKNGESVKLPGYTTNGYNNLWSYQTWETWPTINCNLLLCSTTIISQWQEYFSFAPSLKCAFITNRKEACEVDPKDYDVVVVSHTMYNNFINRHNSKMWKRFVFDEPTSIEVPAMREITALFSWYVTATYKDISYTGRRGSFVAAIFRAIPYDFIQRMLVKNIDSYVNSSFQMPATHYHTYNCYNPAVVEAVKDYISADILEMIKAGDIKGAIKSLGGTSTHTSIIDLVTGKKKKELEMVETRLKKYESGHFSDDEEDDDGANGAGPSNVQEQLSAKEKKKEERQQKWKGKKAELERKIRVLTERFQNILSENCAICCDSMTQPVMLPCCQNIFCGGCIFECLKTQKTCPMCRAPVKASHLVHLDDKDEENDEEDKKKKAKKEKEQWTKPEMVVKLIKEIKETKKEKARIIVFSGHNTSFDIIKRYMKDDEIEFKEVRGTALERKNTIEKYKKGKVSVLFLNSTYNGAGINLQETSDIILYHNMMEHIQTQIIGRANRLGRDQDLDVHALI